MYSKIVFSTGAKTHPVHLNDNTRPRGVVAEGWVLQP